MRNEAAVPFFLQKKKVPRPQILFRNHFDAPFPLRGELSGHIADGLELQLNGRHLFEYIKDRRQTIRPIRSILSFGVAFINSSPKRATLPIQCPGVYFVF